MSSSCSKKRIKNRKGRKKKILISKIFLFLLIIVLASLVIIYFYKDKNGLNINIINEPKRMYLASSTNEISLFKLEEVEINEEESEQKLVEDKTTYRGSEVLVFDKEVKYEDESYVKIEYENNEYYVNLNNLVSKDKEVVLENKVYVKRATVVLDSDNKIVVSLKRGEELEVISYDKVMSNGEVNRYEVKFNDTQGLVYGKYISYTKDESLINYKSEIYDPIHSKIKDSYGGGLAIDLDFYPNEKVEFEDNKMPSSVYSLYLNSGSNVINNIDSYIEFAKETKINAFVIDIKDNETPAYPARTFEELSPTNYNHAINSYDSYKEAIRKVKEAGFYVIGRITVFKDSYYVTDHPENAILDKRTGGAYLHNGSYWPSAYSRDVWYYNVALAIEAVEEFGFNEINFDYVRFPDRMNSVSSVVDLKNTYEESKAEAIQGFVKYATDMLHEKNTYVSIDVFGETTNGTYMTAYGQYWPAISNVADVISGMPYPDHFSSGYYGISKPWNEPYKLMYYWGTYAYERQQEIPTPAKVRTWIQAYDVMKYVDSNGISYGAKEVGDEIRGLYDANLDGGYITWLSNSNLDKYRTQKQAFMVDYREEYNKEDE